MKLYLHIGMHKTGTSAIQSLLRRNSEALQGMGYLYPKHRQHHDGAHHALWSGFDSAEATETHLAGIQSEIDAASDDIHSVILSSELLEKLKNERKKVPNVELFLKYFDDVEVIYFLRNQAELVQSVYKQWIKDDAVRLSLGPREFIDTHWRQLQYSQYVQWWDEHPNVSKLHLARYTGKWDDLWADFSAATGLGDLPAGPAREYNASMDGTQLKIKHWINRNIPAPCVDFNINNWLYRNFPRNPKTSMFRTPEDLEEFQERFAEDNKMLEDAYGVAGLGESNLKGEFFQTASPEVLSDLRDKLAADPDTKDSEFCQVLADKSL